MTRRTPLFLAAVLSLSAVLFAKDAPPVLAYDFAHRLAGVVHDAAGGGHHGTILGEGRYVDSPTGGALLFDGSTVVSARPSGRLSLSDALTLDFWLRWDGEGERSEAIHTTGDRYRLVVNPDGTLHFGLKTADARGDLRAGELSPGAWHRVTATFDRPQMTLYVDGERVGARSWDHSVAPVRALHLGAKNGREFFFRGAIALARVYGYARAPRPGDEELALAAPREAEARLEAHEDDDASQVDTGAMRFTLDKRTGAVRSLSIGDKVLVADNDAPPLFATAMDSDAYDGESDFVPRRFAEAEHALNRIETAIGDDAFSAQMRGTLSFPGGDALDYALGLRAEAGDARLLWTVSLSPSGEFRDRFVRAVGLRQPLALDHRKRVVQAADQGIRWDTRYRYEFHMHVDFATTPEFNWWRHFYVDQESPHSYSIWRGESLGTAPLYAFRGRQAPGYMTLYDQQGGALMGYRNFAARAPKALYAYAEGGGEGVAYLHSPTQPAGDVRDPRIRAALFDEPHEVDWIFFKGEEAFAQPERALAEAWGVEELASDGPPRLEPVADDGDLWDAPAAPGADVPLVAGGVPLPRGAVTQANQARLFVRGRETPAQSRAIAFWPDGSAKWLLLVFPLDGDGGYRFAPGTGEGDEASFQITLRNGEPVPATLRFGRGVRAGTVADGLSVAQGGDGVRIATGPLGLALSPGEQWLSSAVLDGREMLRPGDAPQAFVDYLRTEKLHPAGTTHPEGRPDPGPVRIEKIEVEEEGPLRAVVRLEGQAMSREPATVVIRIEAYAGKPYVRLFHSVVFEHDDPRNAFVRRMGLRFPLALGAERRFDAGGEGGPVTLGPAASTGLRQTSHFNYEVWQREEDARHRLVQDSAHRSRGWLGVSDGQAGMAAAVRDMWQEHPKEIAVRGGDAPELVVGLWPESSPLMDVRRYSNYPHRAQGESVSWDPAWVLERYYSGGVAQQFLAGRKAYAPWGEWHFRTDPENEGAGRGWQRGAEPEGWRPIRVPDWWQRADADSANYLGYAWYRTTFVLPQELAGQDLELMLEGADEQGWVYVNGELVGEQSVESTGMRPGALWDRPFTVTVPAERLRPGRENLLAVRIHAGAGMGGLHRPLYFAVPQDAPVEGDALEIEEATRDPFKGTSKTHELLLVFRNAGDTAERVDSLVADFQSRPLVHAGWDWYAETEATMPLAHPDAPGFRRFHANMENVASWWLFHQKAYGWYGMWDYGDVIHRYRGGYGRIIPPDTLAEILALPRAEQVRVNVRELPSRTDYVPQNDWAFDNGRWGWGNTEGLPNYTMSLMYLLTGRRDLFFFVEANARHVRDVVARHSGIWFGRGTRHGVQHWSCGNHEERQTVFSEQRYHYLLTGEHRTREWNRTLTDNFYLTTTCSRHAAHSGRAYGLLFRWELTGDPELGDIMRRYMRILAQPEGLAIDTAVRFPEAEMRGAPRDLHGGSMFFHTFGAMHAMLDYFYLTGDEQVRDSIIATAEHVLPNLRRGDPGMFRKVIAFAARHALDGERYARVLRDWAGGDGYRYVFQQVPANPDHWYGETSFLVGNVSGGLFWFMDASYMMGALDREPELTERQEGAMERLETRPVLPRPRVPRESWQSEYDRPEFEEYFRDPMLDVLPK